MFHARTNSTVGGVLRLITIGGSGHSYNTQDGDSDTSDTFGSVFCQMELVFLLRVEPLLILLYK